MTFSVKGISLWGVLFSSIVLVNNYSDLKEESVSSSSIVFLAAI